MDNLTVRVMNDALSEVHARMSVRKKSSFEKNVWLSSRGNSGALVISPSEVCVVAKTIESFPPTVFGNRPQVLPLYWQTTKGGSLL